jgi:hypothetical protein
MRYMPLGSYSKELSNGITCWSYISCFINQINRHFFPKKHVIGLESGIEGAALVDWNVSIRVSLIV